MRGKRYNDVGVRYKDGGVRFSLRVCAIVVGAFTSRILFPLVLYFATFRKRIAQLSLPDFGPTLSVPGVRHRGPISQNQEGKIPKGRGLNAATQRRNEQ